VGNEERREECAASRLEGRQVCDVKRREECAQADKR